MAEMAFSVGGLGIPLLGEAGFAVGDVVLGFKVCNSVKIFRMVPYGNTALGVFIQSAKPFPIKDDPILNHLANQTVDLEISGFQTFRGSLSVELKIFENNTVVYTANESVLTNGPCHGGWSMYSIPLYQIYPPDNFLGSGSFGAYQLGLYDELDLEDLRLARDPSGLWEVEIEGSKYFYYFRGYKTVYWFKEFPLRGLARGVYDQTYDGIGDCEINTDQLVISWRNSPMEIWDMPFPLHSNKQLVGKWYPTDRKARVFATRKTGKLRVFDKLCEVIRKNGAGIR